jgi:hypothetical protein
MQEFLLFSIVIMLLAVVAQLARIIELLDGVPA